jgi:hypothetical protein
MNDYLGYYFYRYLFLLIVVYLTVFADSLAQSVLTKYTQAKQSKTLRYEDFVYEGKIRTVLLYPYTGTIDQQTYLPIMSLSQPTPFVLEFDELGEEAGYYMAEIQHCNADWQPSAISPLEYLQDYNEFRLNDFEMSGIPKVHYVHFRWELPKVKLSGNYLLKVYREGDKTDLIITHRFIVFESLVTVNAKQNVVTGGEESQRYQQIDVDISYPSFRLIEPSTSVKTVIRQNGRWDNAKTMLKPLYVDETRRLLDYKYFNLENAFLGGNEFRMFDLRNFNSQGYNVRITKLTQELNTVFLYAEIPREGRVYAGNEKDQNGKYYIALTDGTEAATNADYAEVVFTLKRAEPFENDVYFSGQFNRFALNNDNKMTYSAENQTYTGRYLLKQGFYNYYFTAANPKTGKRADDQIENSYHVTENEYDVIVYYKEPGARYERVIAYQVVKNR